MDDGQMKTAGLCVGCGWAGLLPPGLTCGGVDPPAARRLRASSPCDGERLRQPETCDMSHPQTLAVMLSELTKTLSQLTRPQKPRPPRLYQHAPGEAPGDGGRQTVHRKRRMERGIQQGDRQRQAYGKERHGERNTRRRDRRKEGYGKEKDEERNMGRREMERGIWEGDRGKEGYKKDTNGERDTGRRDRWREGWTEI